MNDFELLQLYIRHGKEEAFAELLNRHLPLVYASALRRVHSPELAEDIAQSVFIDLARQG